MGYNVWFTSDNHIHHKNILKHCPLRAKAGGFDIEDVEAHDRWVLETWNKTVAKKEISNFGNVFELIAKTGDSVLNDLDKKNKK